MSLIDKNIETEFMHDNKLVCDEIIVYANRRRLYIDEYDQYSYMYRVVTINERTGIVKKYMKEGTEVVGDAWFSQIMR